MSLRATRGINEDILMRRLRRRVTEDRWSREDRQTDRQTEAQTRGDFG